MLFICSFKLKYGLRFIQCTKDGTQSSPNQERFRLLKKAGLLESITSSDFFMLVLFNTKLLKFIWFANVKINDIY